MLPLLACIGGILLGLRLTVLVLPPAVLIATVAFIGHNLISHQGLFANIGLLLFCLIIAQAGYLLGLLARDINGQFLARMSGPLSKRV